MKNYNMILTERLQKWRHYHWKIDIYEYFTAEENLSSDQNRMIEQAKFTYSLLGEALEKQTKTNRCYYE